MFSCFEIRVLILNSRVCFLDGFLSIVFRCFELWTFGDTFLGLFYYGCRYCLI